MTLSLPPEMVTKVDVRLAKDLRSRANMLEVILEDSFGREAQQEAASY